ncbi:signal peptidase I [Nocardioides panacis]|uniref:Signal peptidase I n=1 Tax=Nocardioides panacis TaxID=2849501 RepID=A0A975Y0V0_9ACTN|nr:signal peptidase I [Nocardioides panacis]QWZ08704.1 signal peptidase I [Nocardioides panacis]
MHRTAAASRRVSRGLTVLVVLVLGVLAVRLFVAEPLRIRTGSMAPTLTAGEHVLVDKVSRRHGTWRHGDVVALRLGDGRSLLVKRVVALAGERVELRDGRLYVDGHRRVEPYADPTLIDSVYFGPVLVPAGHVFVLGDNRADSRDSRHFGAVALSRLEARVDAVVWPLPPTRGGLAP